MGDCQNYGTFLGPYYNTGPNTGPNLGDPKRDHNFDNHPYTNIVQRVLGANPVLNSHSTTAQKGIEKYFCHMGGCQDYGPFLDPYYNTAPNI